jgi:hypothetical protein
MILESRRSKACSAKTRRFTGRIASTAMVSTPRPPRFHPAGRRVWCDSSPQTPNGKVGLCLERHDLCIAKLVAGRPKDLAFIDLLLRAHRLNEVTLVERLAAVNLVGPQRDVTHSRLAALTGLDIDEIIGDLPT